MTTKPLTVEEAIPLTFETIEPTAQTLHAPGGTPLIPKSKKQPRHVNIAITHMVKQREKAIAIRDAAGKEVESLDAALLSLGWPEE